MAQILPELMATIKQQELHHHRTLDVIDGILKAIACYRQSMELTTNGEQQNDETANLSIESLKENLTALKPTDAVTQEQKQFHAAISRLLKSIDKRFPAAPARLFQPTKSDEHDTALTKMVALHLYQRGYLDAADALTKEASIPPPPPTTLGPLKEIHRVTRALENHDLEPAKRWTSERAQQLQQIHSLLPFQLARLEFVTMISANGNSGAALLFAQQKLASFSQTHMPEIQALMGAVLWSGRLPASPYADLLSQDHWTEACETLTCDGCRLSGLPKTAHLATAFAAGLLAWPTLRKMEAVVRSSNVREWKVLNELPVQLEALNNQGFSFHSIFSCPVSRELSSATDPPVLLRCGHVICSSSMQRIPKNGSRFKCPTCPMEQRTEDTRLVYL